MKKYTQAIAVDKDFLYTLLIKRNNEPGQGLLSGIGGHIEDGESPDACMRREWAEETGTPLPDDAILYPLMTQITDCENHIFGIILPAIDIYFTHQDDTDNEGFIRWHHILGEHIMDLNNPRLAWNGMIPYCLKLMMSEFSAFGTVHDDDRWITIHPNNGTGRKVKIDENGNIVGGSIPKSSHGENIHTWAKKESFNKQENLAKIKREYTEHVKSYGNVAQLQYKNMVLEEKLRKKKKPDLSTKAMEEHKKFNEKEITYQQSLSQQIKEQENKVTKNTEFNKTSISPANEINPHLTTHKIKEIKTKSNKIQEELSALKTSSLSDNVIQTKLKDLEDKISALIKMLYAPKGGSHNAT